MYKYKLFNLFFTNFFRNKFRKTTVKKCHTFYNFKSFNKVFIYYIDICGYQLLNKFLNLCKYDVLI